MQSNHMSSWVGARVAGAAVFLLLVAMLQPSVSRAANAPPAAAPVAAPVEVVDTDPGKLIETAAQAMLAELDAHRAEFRKDPAKINDLVDRILLPHFDTSYSARLVLGRHWNSATPEQRQRFIDGFYHSLLTNYGTALLDFTGDRLKVFPYKAAASCSCLTLLAQAMEWALPFALERAGNNKLARMAMMAMTTSSSIKVKAEAKSGELRPQHASEFRSVWTGNSTSFLRARHDPGDALVQPAMFPHSKDRVPEYR